MAEPMSPGPGWKMVSPPTVMSPGPGWKMVSPPPITAQDKALNSAVTTGTGVPPETTEPRTITAGEAWSPPAMEPRTTEQWAMAGMGSAAPMGPPLPTPPQPTPEQLLEEKFTQTAYDEANRRATPPSGQIAAKKFGTRTPREYDEYASEVAKRLGTESTPEFVKSLKPVLDAFDIAHGGISGAADVPKELRNDVLGAMQHVAKSRDTELEPGWTMRTLGSAAGQLAQVGQSIRRLNPFQSKEDWEFEQQLLNVATNPERFTHPDQGFFSRNAQGALAALPTMAAASLAGGTPGVALMFGLPSAVKTEQGAKERGATPAAAATAGVASGVIETALFSRLPGKIIGSLGGEAAVSRTIGEAAKRYAIDTLKTGGILTAAGLKSKLAEEGALWASGKAGKSAGELFDETINEIPDSLMQAALLHAVGAAREATPIALKRLGQKLGASHALSKPSAGEVRQNVEGPGGAEVAQGTREETNAPGQGGGVGQGGPGARGQVSEGVVIDASAKNRVDAFLRNPLITQGQREYWEMIVSQANSGDVDAIDRINTNKLEGETNVQPEIQEPVAPTAAPGEPGVGGQLPSEQPGAEPTGEPGRNDVPVLRGPTEPSEGGTGETGAGVAPADSRKDTSIREGGQSGPINETPKLGVHPSEAPIGGWVQVYGFRENELARGVVVRKFKNAIEVETSDGKKQILFSNIGFVMVEPGKPTDPGSVKPPVPKPQELPTSPDESTQEPPDYIEQLLSERAAEFYDREIAPAKERLKKAKGFARDKARKELAALEQQQKDDYESYRKLLLGAMAAPPVSGEKVAEIVGANEPQSEQPKATEPAPPAGKRLGKIVTGLPGLEQEGEATAAEERFATPVLDQLRDIFTPDAVESRRKIVRRVPGLVEKEAAKEAERLLGDLDYEDMKDMTPAEFADTVGENVWNDLMDKMPNVSADDIRGSFRVGRREVTVVGEVQRGQAIGDAEEAQTDMMLEAITNQALKIAEPILTQAKEQSRKESNRRNWAEHDVKWGEVAKDPAKLLSEAQRVVEEMFDGSAKVSSDMLRDIVPQLQAEKSWRGVIDRAHSIAGDYKMLPDFEERLRSMESLIEDAEPTVEEQVPERPETPANPERAVFTQKVTQRGGRDYVIRTFTGSTQEEYDRFLDSRPEGAQWRNIKDVMIDGRPRNASYDFPADSGLEAPPPEPPKPKKPFGSVPVERESDYFGTWVQVAGEGRDAGYDAKVHRVLNGGELLEVSRVDDESGATFRVPGYRIVAVGDIPKSEATLRAEQEQADRVKARRENQWTPPPIERTTLRAGTPEGDKQRANWQEWSEKGNDKISEITQAIAPLRNELKGTRRNAHKKRAKLQEEIREKERAIEDIRKEQRPFFAKLEIARVEDRLESAPSEAHYQSLAGELARLRDSRDSAGESDRRFTALEEMVKDEFSQYKDVLNDDELKYGAQHVLDDWWRHPPMHTPLEDSVKAEVESKIRLRGETSVPTEINKLQRLTEEEKAPFLDRIKQTQNQRDWWQQQQAVLADARKADEAANERYQAEQAKKREAEAKQAAIRAREQAKADRMRRKLAAAEPRFWDSIREDAKKLKGQVGVVQISKEVPTGKKDEKGKDITKAVHQPMRGEILPGNVWAIVERYKASASEEEKTAWGDRYSLTHVPTGLSAESGNSPISLKELVALINRLGVDLSTITNADTMPKEVRKALGTIHRAWDDKNTYDLNELGEGTSERILSQYGAKPTLTKADVILDAGDFAEVRGAPGPSDARIRMLAKEVPEFSYDPVFIVEPAAKPEWPGDVRLVYRDGYKFSFKPDMFGLVADELKPGMTVGVNLEDLGIKRSEPIDVVKAKLEEAGFEVSKRKEGLTARRNPTMPITSSDAEVKAAKDKGNILDITGSGHDWKVTERKIGLTSYRAVAEDAIRSIRWEQPKREYGTGGATIPVGRGEENSQPPKREGWQKALDDEASFFDSLIRQGVKYQPDDKGGHWEQGDKTLTLDEVSVITARPAEKLAEWAKKKQESWVANGRPDRYGTRPAQRKRGGQTLQFVPPATDPGSVTEQAQREADQRQREQDERTKRLGFAIIPGGVGAAQRVRPDVVPEGVKVPDESIEARIQKSHGIKPEGFMTRVAEAAANAWHKATRPHEHIPNTDRFATVRERFRLLEVIRGRSADEVNRTVAAIVDPLGPKQKILFERKLMAENMLASLDRGEPLRFGFESRDDVQSYRDQLDALVAQTPEVQRALDTRKAVAEELVTALTKHDLLPEEALDKTESYWHQQVLDRMQVNRMATGAAHPGKMIRGFQKRRVKGDVLGEEYDYNTDYIQAEAAWMTDARIELAKEKWVRDLNHTEGIMGQLKSQAKEENFVDLVGGQKNADRIYELRGLIRESREGPDANESYARQQRAEWIEELQDLDPTYPHRQKIAMFLDNARRAVESSTVNSVRWQEVLDMGEDAADDPRFLSMLGHVAARDPGSPLGLAARGLFKWVNERESLIQNALGNRYRTWETLLKGRPDYAAWQPQPGNVFYSATTIPEQLAEQLRSGAVQELQLTPGQLRTVMAIGGPRQEMVLPKEIVDQLDSMDKAKPRGPVAEVAREMQRDWKVWTLLNPKRALAYNLRNATGDVDPVFAGAPFILGKIEESRRELADYYSTKLSLSRDLRTTRDLGVLDSTMTVQEIPDLADLDVFKRFYGTRDRNVAADLVKKYFDTVKKWTNFREALLRLAAFKYYRDALNAGTLTHYGAAKKSTIVRLQRDMGSDVAAAHLARNLLGDYGNLTVMGRYMREQVFPYWSWVEVNLKRYPRMAINAVDYGVTKGKQLGMPAGAVYMGIAMVGLAGLYAAQWAWNHLKYPDDEDQLGTYDRANPHIMLGRNEDGTLRFFRNTGALGDFLEWFGINSLSQLYPKYRDGQISLWDVAKEMAKDPLNKFVQGLRPDVKTTAEVATGKSLFPDVTQPRTVDRGEAAAGLLGLQDELKAARGYLAGSGERAKTHYGQRILMGVSDPKANSLAEIHELRGDFLRKEGKERPEDFGASPIKYMREAAVADDFEAFKKAKAVYLKSGKTPKNFEASLRYIDPMRNRLNAVDERKFLNFLTGPQREKLKTARGYAGELERKMRKWWRESAKPATPKN